MSNILIVHVYVDETAQFVPVIVKMASQFGILVGQMFQRFAGSGCLHLDMLLSANKLAQRGGNGNRY
jgi:hypothetical protein